MLSAAGVHRAILKYTRLLWSILAAAGMRQRSRRHVLLQQYELDPSSSLRLAARSEAHEKAHVRMRPSDVETLRRPAGEGSSPIVALFSTRYAQEAVQLRADEALYVRLPAGEAEGRGRAGEAGGAAAPAAGEQAPPRGRGDKCASRRVKRCAPRLGRPPRLRAPRVRHRHARLRHHAQVHRAPRARQDAVGSSCTIRAVTSDLVLLRPCIEHYMLGVIFGRGGGPEELVATFWGQTELSCYDDSQHGS